MGMFALGAVVLAVGVILGAVIVIGAQGTVKPKE